MTFDLRPIGVVESTLRDLQDAPPQGDERAPEAWLVIEPTVAAGLEGLAVGDRV
ncbi:MAG: tRNA (N6-threonylcarbamoyladenosine(37)-N6)-methyltransferase TrmO, partial [Acidimicrobiia bacterium]|nr:tRNA (N6-threonylcarbamoyladenosine(37)-N6)-methyltransferase TrmO [Acidimicrobiia bacterium]